MRQPTLESSAANGMIANRRRAPVHLAGLGPVVVLLVPAGLVLGLAPASGGFFPDAVSVAAIVVIAVLVVRLVATVAPFSGMSAGLGVVMVALIVFTTWTLLSGSWSGSPARATFEYDRALLYTAVFVVIGVLGRSAGRARILLYGLTVVSTAVCVAAAATWLLPDVFPVTAAIPRSRLSWPTSYWNATGLLAAFALVWSSSLCCSSSAPPRVRVLAAMAAPLPAATLIFTVSRGAVAAAALGMLVAVVMIRSSATPGGLATLIPAIGLTVARALSVSGLNVPTPSTHAVHAGHRVALVLVAVVLGAGGLRMALLRLDRRLAAARVPWTRGQFRVALGAAVVVLAVAFVALGGPRAVRRDAHAFVSPDNVSAKLPTGQRLTQLGNNGRLDEWRVALVDGFERHPWNGIGAGSYATLWTRHSPVTRRVLNAHSLYLEELAELGIIGGGVLVVAIGGILVGLARRARGPEREVWAALLAGGVMWALHAGVDWDWQMPAITAWFFAAGGIALAAPVERPGRTMQPLTRYAVALACLLLTVTPAVVWRSQTQIVKAVTAFERGDCTTAQRAALASNAALSSRWDPFEVISYCQAGAGQYPLALSAIQAAESRDPQNWELRYSDSLISAAAGLDPRPAASAALARYPTSPLVRAAVRAFSRGGPKEWLRFAVSAPLPLPTNRQ